MDSATCHKLSEAFYARVAGDPLLRPLFPGKTFTCAIEEFSAFLVQIVGGPSEDSQRRWWLSLYESHRRFRIGPEHRAAWLRCMGEAFHDAGIEEPERAQWRSFFEHSSAYVIGSAGPSAPMAPGLAHQWESQRALDDAVAAVRRGDGGRAIELAAQCDRVLLPGLLALMLTSGQADLREFVYGQLRLDRGLGGERYGGRTLLHVAAGRGDAATVELLLKLGVDPNIADGGSHTPLYSAANEGSGPGGAGVVRLLVDAGARVDACDGVMRCTPLHMAARRGNVAVARALLECGAKVNARDRRGDTPLQRALNCRKPEVAELLRSYL